MKHLHYYIKWKSDFPFLQKHRDVCLSAHAVTPIKSTWLRRSITARLVKPKNFVQNFSWENRQENNPLGTPRMTCILGEPGYEHMKRVEVVRDCFDTECIVWLKPLHQTPKKSLRLCSCLFCYDARELHHGQSLCHWKSDTEISFGSIVTLLVQRPKTTSCILWYSHTHTHTHNTDVNTKRHIYCRRPAVFNTSGAGFPNTGATVYSNSRTEIMCTERPADINKVARRRNIQYTYW
jgi:hypothetical protein